MDPEADGERAVADPGEPSTDPRRLVSPATDAAAALLGALVEQGVRHVVLSPGSRSQALALVAAELERRGALSLHVRIDERVAGFTALGIGRETGMPAAVVCTSGTAVAAADATATLTARLSPSRSCGREPFAPARRRSGSASASASRWSPAVFTVVGGVVTVVGGVVTVLRGATLIVFCCCTIVGAVDAGSSSSLAAWTMKIAAITPSTTTAAIATNRSDREPPSSGGSSGGGPPAAPSLAGGRSGSGPPGGGGPAGGMLMARRGCQRGMSSRRSLDHAAGTARACAPPRGVVLACGGL